MTPDPCDLRSLDPRTRDLTLAAVRGWTCRWPCPPDGPRLVMPAKPYQPPQAGRAPGRAYDPYWMKRNGYFADGDRLYEDPGADDPVGLWCPIAHGGSPNARPPRDPSLDPGRGGGRLL